MRFLSPITAAISFSASLVGAMPAEASTTYLVLGTYKQSNTSKPEAASYSSSNIQLIPIESVEQCEVAGSKIYKDIYRPVKNFNGQWTCVEGK